MSPRPHPSKMPPSPPTAATSPAPESQGKPKPHPAPPQGPARARAAPAPASATVSRAPNWWGALTFPLPRGLKNSLHPASGPRVELSPACLPTKSLVLQQGGLLCPHFPVQGLPGTLFPRHYGDQILGEQDSHSILTPFPEYHLALHGEVSRPSPWSPGIAFKAWPT